MKIAVLRERETGEARVAATPETVGKLIALGASVTIEQGAGDASRYRQAEYATAGASIAASPAEAVADAEIILCVRRPHASLLNGAKPGALLIGALDPYGQADPLGELARAGIVAISMEFMPRITRAQVMDILSSQANLAGYQAVIEAASEFDRAFPMMMTAAGTVRPAKAFIMGAGVAGLQAIATAKRLGAVVSATDVRPAAKEQVESLGGKFIAIEDEEFKQAETAGGYAKEMSVAYREKQAALTASHIAKQDIVITTALIPGRPAPRLITREMVESMAPGSVIVDLAAERGGNVELTEPGRVVERGGVKLIGYTNMQGRIPTTASQLYARNLLAFVETLVDKATRTLNVNWDDELVKATVLTRDGAIVHPNFRDAAVASAPVETPTTLESAELAVPAMAQNPTDPQTLAEPAGLPPPAQPNTPTPPAKTRARRAGPANQPAETGALDGPVAFVPPAMEQATEATPRPRRVRSTAIPSAAPVVAEIPSPAEAPADTPVTSRRRRKTTPPEES